MDQFERILHAPGPSCRGPADRTLMMRMAAAVSCPTASTTRPGIDAGSHGTTESSRPPDDHAARVRLNAAADPVPARHNSKNCESARMREIEPRIAQTAIERIILVLNSHIATAAEFASASRSNPRALPISAGQPCDCDTGSLWRHGRSALP